MRLRLVGYSGVRPPVPGTVPVSPEDPEPAPETPPDEIPQPLVLFLNDGEEFHKGDYLALGYNRFDVMCIGGAGGRSGTVKETIPDSASHAIDLSHYDYDLYWDAPRYIFGGAGGGGGVHRVKGRLALLPTTIPVVVGQPGADGGYSEVRTPFHDWRSGANGYPLPSVPPSGGDGGASSFGIICRASGGKGANGSFGGPGGIGNADGAGGGPFESWTANTGGPGNSNAPTTSAHLNNGSWDGKIGAGGAGGVGSVVAALNGDVAAGGARLGGDLNGGHNGYSSAGDGASGAYSAGDTSVSGKGQLGSGFGIDYSRIIHQVIYPADGPPYLSGYNYVATGYHFDAIVAIPGAGGGATTFPLTGDLTQYGSKAQGRDGKGAVVIRLSYAIV